MLFSIISASNSKHANQNPTPNIPILLFLLIIITTSSPALLQYKTKYTNCTITVQYSNGDQPNQTVTISDILTDKNAYNVKWRECAKQMCIRNLINGNCANIQNFKFDQQQTCNKQCCGNALFSYTACQQYNDDTSSSQQSINFRLAIILSIVSASLVIALAIFMLYYIECLNKPSKLAQTQSHASQCKWKNSKYNSQVKCEICNETRAFVMHKCGKFYHSKCLHHIDGWQCVRCQQKIRKMKVYCPVCEKKSIVIRADSFAELETKIVEMYEFHPGECGQFLAEQFHTERKFTQTTKE